jgi:hypothetical protein
LTVDRWLQQFTNELLGKASIMSDHPFSLPPSFDGNVRLFPLPDLVMFPGIMLPLHIFESRYRRGERGTGLICRNGPEGASHKLAPSPFSLHDFVNMTLTSQANKGLDHWASQQNRSLDRQRPKRAALVYFAHREIIKPRP